MLGLGFVRLGSRISGSGFGVRIGFWGLEQGSGLTRSEFHVT